MKHIMNEFLPSCGPLSGITFIAAMLVLAACGDKPQSPPQLFKQERNALDKAREVAPAANKQAEDARNEEDRQTQ